MNRKTTSAAALVARINRHLRQSGHELRRCAPGSRDYYNLGDYYVIDDHRNVVARDVGLEAYAREAGLLAW